MLVSKPVGFQSLTSPLCTGNLLLAVVLSVLALLRPQAAMEKQAPLLEWSPHLQGTPARTKLISIIHHALPLWLR